MSEALARKFHEAYERLAPQFGYETRQDTRAFDPESPNGKLMIAACGECFSESVARETYEAAVKGRADFREALRESRDYAEELREALVGVIDYHSLCADPACGCRICGARAVLAKSAVAVPSCATLVTTRLIAPQPSETVTAQSGHEIGQTGAVRGADSGTYSDGYREGLKDGREDAQGSHAVGTKFEGQYICKNCGKHWGFHPASDQRCPSQGQRIPEGAGHADNPSGMGGTPAGGSAKPPGTNSEPLAYLLDFGGASRSS